MLAHCSSSSEWVPGGNTGEITATRNGTGRFTSDANGSVQYSSLTGTPLRTKVHGTRLSAIFCATNIKLMVLC